MIYFIKDTGSLAIKIGRSKHPKKRVPDLQTGNPSKLVLLGTVTGGDTEEGQYHALFAQHRLEGEWFKGEIIEEVLTIIEQHKQHRITVRRRVVMAEVTPESGNVEAGPPPEAGTLDKDSGIRGFSRIPGLRLKSFSLKLSERPHEQPAQKKGFAYCGFDLRYLLEFETNFTEDAEAQQYNLRKLHIALLHGGQDKGLWHTFYDEDNAVIPFWASPAESHIIGGKLAITGQQGDAFKVIVSHEQLLNPSHPATKIKDVFMGDNYTGEHPLAKAKKLVVSIRGPNI